MYRGLVVLLHRIGTDADHEEHHDRGGEQQGSPDVEAAGETVRPKPQGITAGPAAAFATRNDEVAVTATVFISAVPSDPPTC